MPLVSISVNFQSVLSNYLIWFNGIYDCFVVTYSWYHIRSNEVLSKNEEEVATERSMKNLKIAMHRQDNFMLVMKKQYG